MYSPHLILFSLSQVQTVEKDDKDGRNKSGSCHQYFYMFHEDSGNIKGTGQGTGADRLSGFPQSSIPVLADLYIGKPGLFEVTAYCVFRIMIFFCRFFFIPAEKDESAVLIENAEHLMKSEHRVFPFLHDIYGRYELKCIGRKGKPFHSPAHKAAAALRYFSPVGIHGRQDMGRHRVKSHDHDIFSMREKTGHIAALPAVNIQHILLFVRSFQPGQGRR